MEFSVHEPGRLGISPHSPVIELELDHKMDEWFAWIGPFLRLLIKNIYLFTVNCLLKPGEVSGFSKAYLTSSCLLRPGLKGSTGFRAGQNSETVLVSTM